MMKYNHIDNRVMIHKESLKLSKKRVKLMEKKKDNSNIESINEEQIMYSDDDLYNINSWGADLSFREIINMYKDNDLIKPELQRKYVWTKEEASRFIDSVLLGLPVPSIFLAKEPDETMLIIDGFQRIMTVFDFVNGVFSGDGRLFKLTNTENINIHWRGKSFEELTVEEKRRIKNTTIHAIIFEQKHPKNDTGMFQIFERINTGGRTLKPQEIRNCVYQGSYNDLLFRLNKNEKWRMIIGSENEDPRMADLELILRFFAMSNLIYRPESKNNQINLAKYLNNYMGDNCKADEEEIKKMEKSFIEMIDACSTVFGIDSFKNLKKDASGFSKKINPAIFDAISVSTSFVLCKGAFDKNNNYKDKYIELLNNPEFQNITSHRTTNVNNIISRINMATKMIYGIEYEK